MDFGDPLGVPPQKGDFVSGTDMYHHANFTPIGATVAEISVTEHIGPRQIITTDYISDFISGLLRTLTITILNSSLTVDIIKSCQSYFSFQLPSAVLSKRVAKFDIKFKNHQNQLL